MNVWRWLGISLFLITAVALIGTTQFTGTVGGQGTTTKKVETTTKKDTTTTTTPAATTTTTKQEEKKKEDPVKDPPKVEAKAGDTLVFKAFEPKSKFYQKQVTVTEQKMTANNQPVVQTQKQTFIIEWSAGDKDKDGNFIVTQKIVGVEMEISIGGNKINYDSTLPNQPKNPMTDFFDQLIKKSELVYTIAPPPNLKVLKVEKSEELIKALGDVNPQMQNLLKEILKNEALVKMAEPAWWAFPPGGVIPADKKWTKESSLSLGPIGTYASTFNFEWKSTKDNKDTIGITTKLVYSAPTVKTGLPFVITEAKLQSESGTGEAIFDRAKGRFEKSEIKMKLGGTLSIEVSGMTTAVTLDQTQTATSETFDTNPWEKKNK